MLKLAIFQNTINMHWYLHMKYDNVSTIMHYGVSEHNLFLKCYYLWLGFPIPFVMIGIASRHEQYGVRDLNGTLQL